MNKNKNYELFSQMDADKFFDFIIMFFENMGMKDEYIPLSCTCCPLRRECKMYGDEETTCLEFLAERLK